MLVHQAIHHPEFLTLVSEYTLESCRRQVQYPALIAFWGGLMTEGINGLLERTKSGRAAVQSEKTQSLLHRLGPIFADALVMKDVPNLQVATYMAMTIFVSRGNLEDSAVTALMQQTVHGWTNDTVRPGLVCLAILAQYRSAKQMNNKVAKALTKVSDIGSLLVEIGQERRVDKLANGLCLALIERLTKKADARGLSTITTILSGKILQDKQTAVIFKSLLLTALKLDDANDEDGSLRRELGSVLISLSQTAGRVGDIVQSVIQDVEFDIEELEMKLDLSFRSRNIKENPETPEQEKQVLHRETADEISQSIGKVASKKTTLPTCLEFQASDIFNDVSHIFFSIVSDSTKYAGLLEQLDECPKLGRKNAFKDSTYFTFFVRICSGPYPALARAAALGRVKNRLLDGQDIKTDVQWLVPYCIAALADPSKRVRQAAADLIAVVSQRYSKGNTGKDVWGTGSFYGKKADVKPIAADDMQKFLQLQLLPNIEACILDPEQICKIVQTSIEHGTYAAQPEASVDKKDHMSQSSRLALLTFFASHTVSTPLLVIKERLLKSLNGARGKTAATRAKLLLPVLQWWVGLENTEVDEMCEREQVDKTVLDGHLVDVIVPQDEASVQFTFELLASPNIESRPDLAQALFARIKKVWSSMKDDTKFAVAEQFLELSQQTTDGDAANTVVSTEAADFLRTVPLTTEILSFFLNSIQTGTKMITEPPPNKRRRTSSSGGDRSLLTQVTPELSQALRRVTFVLQLVDSCDPASHPELLDGLFTALSELQHFRTVVGSELGYLQNLILRILLAMMPAYKANKDLSIDSSGGYGDLLVNCIQKSSSPVVQNAALLLVANLATIAPNLVLHSVMPIFTFMGTSVLRQNDDYSAHVVAQTVKEVVPPLIASLRKGKKSPIAGATDILVSFTTAYEHIPAHRRLGLFQALVETLGAREFLFALVAMLVDRYDTAEGLLHFVVDLMNNFSIEVQLDTLVKLIDLTGDLFKPKPTISALLLGIGEDDEHRDVSRMALRQLSAIPSFLTSRKLTSQISKLIGRDDMEAEEVRSLYSTLLENVLQLSQQVKENKVLRSRCGAILSNLLNLLSISEFIKSVENLLERPDMNLRQKVLRALEVRVESEKSNDAEARVALLAFLPQLTAVIRESSDLRYKYTAVTCVDKIAEKYGKKDIEAVVAAASIISGDQCLGQEDRGLRIMAILCLTSLVDVLQDAIVPVLPAAIPRVVEYLGNSVSIESKDAAEVEVDTELHSASYGFISAVADHLPFMFSNHIDSVLKISNRSAEVEDTPDAVESRTGCLETMAKKLDGREFLEALLRNWDNALTEGAQAISEILTMLGVAIDKQSKSVISKNSSLLCNLVLRGFDVRRQGSGLLELSEVETIETTVRETAMKMIYKLNDAAFRPIFQQFLEWPGTGLRAADSQGRAQQDYSVYGFLETFFDTLKSIVTNYSTYVLDDAIRIITPLLQSEATALEFQLWQKVIATLSKSFEHDQDDFWQAPAHFSAIAPVLLTQFTYAPNFPITEDLVPAIVELASAADSQTHQKELNSELLKLMRSEQKSVRLAAVMCQQALTERLGEEWMSNLHEMLPRISELQDDGDEEVERETHRWIIKIESVMGESLDAMLQ